MYECSNMRERELDCCDHLQIVLICTSKPFRFSTDKQLVLYICNKMPFRIKATIKRLQHDIRSVDSHFNCHFVSCWWLCVCVCVCFCVWVLQDHVIRTTVCSSSCWTVRPPALLEPTGMFLSIPPSATQRPAAQRQRQTNTPVSFPVIVNQAVHCYPRFSKFTNAHLLFI